MSSHPSSRRATSRASKNIGGSENFDDEGEGGKVSPVGFGFNMGTSGDAGEMIESIYRIFIALQVGLVSIVGARGGSSKRVTYAPHRRRLSVRLNVQPLRPPLFLRAVGLQFRDSGFKSENVVYRVYVDVAPGLSGLPDTDIVCDAEQLSR